MGDRTILRWAIAAGGCLAVAAIWYGLYSQFISVPPIPEVPGLSDAESVNAYFMWYGANAWQDVGIDLVFTIGLLATAGLGRAMTTLAATQTASMPGGIGWDTAGRLLVAGAVIGAIGALTTAGRHDAMVVATAALPRQAPASIANFLGDESFDALLGGAFALMGLGQVASAIAGRATRTVPAGWSAIASLLGALSVVVAGLYLANDPVPGRELLLLVAGVVLFPAWSIWLGLRSASPNGVPDMRAGLAAQATGPVG